MHKGKIRGKGFNLKCVATNMDGKEIPVPEKPTITESSPRDVIEYKGRIFEVAEETIFYLANQPDVLKSRIERTLENGMGHMYSDGGWGCFYCNHYSMNLAKLVDGMVKKNEGGVVISNMSSDPRISGRNCSYEGTMGVKWATRLTHGDTGTVVMAQPYSCVVSDSMISELAERGLLNEYEVQGREFDFPTVGELEKNPELMKTFGIAVDRKQQAKGFFKRFYSLTLGKLFS